MKLSQVLTGMTLALGVFFFQGYHVHAQTLPAPIISSEVEVVAPEAVLSDEEKSLATLKQEVLSLKNIEKDPETGSVMKFLIRFKIRQLENQLNIKKALK